MELIKAGGGVSPSPCPVKPRRLCFPSTSSSATKPSSSALRHGIIAEHASNQYISFEVDRLDGMTNEGWSVLVVGLARPVRDPVELERLRKTAPVQPWAAGDRDLFITIIPKQVTGRRIEHESMP